MTLLQKAECNLLSAEESRWLEKWLKAEQGHWLQRLLQQDDGRRNAPLELRQKVRSALRQAQ